MTRDDGFLLHPSLLFKERVQIRLVPNEIFFQKVEMNKGMESVAVILCCMFFFIAHPCLGQEAYPTRPVQIVVPYAAGGSIDLIGRMVAEKFRDYFGQPFVVVNKPGATGAIASGFVSGSKPDGYNVYAASGATLEIVHSMNPSIYGLGAMNAVAAYAKFAPVIIVNKDLPVKTLAEFVAHVKKNPRTLSYGTTGHGGGGHVAMELLKMTVPIATDDLPHIPYPGVAPTLNALLGNQVQIAIVPCSALVVKQIEAGTLRALSVLSPKRLSFRPEIRSVVEEGFPQLADSLYYLSFWVPARTPAPILKKLEEATKKVTEDKEIQKKIEDMYHEVEFLNPQRLGKYVEDQVQTWVPIMKRLNIAVQ
jgi:tripartite-type tricarboxylate transporter receptor subunit TctC